MSPSLYDEVLMHAQRTQSTAEEAILQLGLMSEAELLKYIAGLYRTRFVGSDRLAKAGVDPSLLKSVPRKLAKRLTAFPILYDKRNRTLFGRRRRCHRRRRETADAVRDGSTRREGLRSS